MSKGHLSICMHYSNLFPTMKGFRRFHTSMCFEASCYYKCTLYKLWWTCTKDWRLTACLIRKESIFHRYNCLSHSLFPIHLSEDKTNTTFVHVFSLLGSLMWSGHFSQGCCKRCLIDPAHFPIKQTRFRLHIKNSSIRKSTEICGKNKKHQHWNLPGIRNTRNEHFLSFPLHSSWW